MKRSLDLAVEGAPHECMTKYTSIEDRFWAKVSKGPGLFDCWEWTASRNTKGYGQFGLRGRRLMAHRLSYEWLIGPIGEGLQIDHLCRVRNCVNPAHLEPVTCKENLRRGEGPAARNTRKATCPHGHPYAGDNLYVSTDGKRRCRECHRSANRRWKRQRKTAAGIPSAA